MSTSAKLWGGRFQKPTHELVDQLNASLPFDQRLARHDILGSLAHVTMLARQGIVPLEDARAIAQGLRTILREIEEQRFTFRLADEDIHLSVERRLRELIGPVAGRLHTARSRNDQVVLDFRLWSAISSRLPGGSSRQLRHCSLWPRHTGMSSCRVIPTCSGHSLCCSRITCTPT